MPEEYVENTRMKLGAVILKIRELRGIGQEAFGHPIGIGLTTISDLENGKEMGFGTLKEHIDGILQEYKNYYNDQDKKEIEGYLSILEERQEKAPRAFSSKQFTSLLDKIDKINQNLKSLSEVVHERAEFTFSSLKDDKEEIINTKAELNRALECYWRILRDKPRFKTSAETAITRFVAEMGELSSGRSIIRRRSREELFEDWASILGDAEPGETVFATSIVGLPWWKDFYNFYMDINRAAIEKGVRIVRIFIVGQSELEKIAWGAKGTKTITVPNKEQRQVMSEHARMGVQVNWVEREKLKNEPRDILCGGVKLEEPAKLQEIDNKKKRIKSIEIVGEQIFESPSEEPTEWKELSRTVEYFRLYNARNYLEEYYRKSVRFAYPEWYRDFYTPDYLKIDTNRNKICNEEANQIRNLLCKYGFPEGRAKLLDLGCGHGRIAIPLVEVLPQTAILGIDISDDMLTEAESRTPEELRPRLKFDKLDLKDLEKYLKENRLAGKFDAALSMYTSFGYLSDDDNLKILKAIVLALKPGGLFLVDLDDKKCFIKDQEKPRPPYASGNGDIWKVWRYDCFNEETSCRMSQYVVEEEHKVKVKPLFFSRLYDEVEIRRILFEAGLETVCSWSCCQDNFLLSQYSAGSAERIVVIARKVKQSAKG